MPHTKQRIVDAAVTLFSESGYHNVTMQQIAEAAGISPGSFYNHFDSKEALLNRISEDMNVYLQNYMPDNTEIDRQLKTDSVRTVLRRFALYYEEDQDLHRHTAYCRILYMGMYYSERLTEIAYRCLIRDPVGALVQTLDHLQEQGHIPPCDSAAVAHLWVRTTVVFGYQAAHDWGGVPWGDYRKLNEFFVDLILRGVRQIPTENVSLEWRQGYLFPDLEGELSTRDRILLTAVSLFSEKGYADVTMRQIAKEANLRASSLYHHFAGKKEIMRAVTEEFLVGRLQYSIKNPAFTAVLESHNEGKIILSLSSAYQPPERSLIRRVYKVLFREQYLDKDLQQFFLDSITRDCEAIRHSLDELVGEGRVGPLACESWMIATAYVHAMCSITVGSTVDQPLASEEYLRPRMVAPLVSLILYGYVRADEDAALPVP